MPAQRSMAFWMMSRLVSRSGKMLIAASVMKSVSGWPGTSMTKTWLIRRSVRRPVAEAVTSCISSSVCRLPFIRSSPLPSRISATAWAAAAWLCGASTIWRPARSMPCSAATARIFASGPTSTGSISRSAAASIAPRSEVSSQGWATIVTAGEPSRAAAIRRSYFESASVSGTGASPSGCLAPRARRESPARGRGRRAPRRAAGARPRASSGAPLASTRSGAPRRPRGAPRSLGHQAGDGARAPPPRRRAASGTARAPAP